MRLFSFGKLFCDFNIQCCGCFTSNIPATSYGFYGNMARLDCSKCTKEFNEHPITGRISFGGFDVVWPLQNEEEHREQAYESMRQVSRSARDKVEVKYGYRFSALMHLEYFDCVRLNLIDPMHNLFLGTAKHVVKNVWISEENPIIPKNLYGALQEKVDKCIVPSSLGRIPYKIASSFSSFTADEWKIWTMVLSLFALHDVPYFTVEAPTCFDSYNQPRLGGGWLFEHAAIEPWKCPPKSISTLLPCSCINN